MWKRMLRNKFPNPFGRGWDILHTAKPSIKDLIKSSYSFQMEIEASAFKDCNYIPLKAVLGR